MVKSVFNIATTDAIWVSKRVSSGRTSGELVFHPLVEDLPVGAGPSGENFPSPFNQFQSIGPKKFQIPIPLATYVHNLPFVRILLSFHQTVPKRFSGNLTVLIGGLIIKTYKIVVADCIPRMRVCA